MAPVARWLLVVKAWVGRRYRRVQREVEHVVFERGLHSTWSPDVSSGHLYLARGLRGCRVGREDVLMDYGAGKGRVLLAAARLPFGRIVGLELNEADAEIARANASIAGPHRRCPRIEVVVADARLWPLPDDVTYIYLFNPFWDETFKGMLDRVLESLDRRPRQLTVIYANPTCAAELLATGRFERVRTSRGLRRGSPAQRIDVFRST
ncbi:MAG TPA: class I SAM-dependent methyltransferase [Solirubrobacteraceae bacterium]|jgi:predicted RNA methylase|nr:class I SAM-dependent methyltransferase [Solirubrobacteraceae bacterium]